MRAELAAFLLAFVASSAFVAIPYLLLQLKGIPIEKRVPANKIVLELGAINATFMLSRALGSWRASAKSPKLGAALVGSGLLLMTLPSLPAVVLGRALQGLGSGLTFPALETEASKRGVSGMVRLSIAQNLGFSAGSLFAGAALGFPQEPLLLSAPLAFGASFVVPLGTKSKSRGKSNNALKILYLTAFVNGVSLGSRGPALAAYVLQYVSALPSSFSTVWGVPGLVAMGLSYSLARALDSLKTEHKLYASSAFKLLQTLSIALIPFVRDVWSLVGLLTLSRIGSMLSVSASKAAQGRLSGRVEHFGARQASFSLGNAVGPLVGATLYKVTGPSALFFIAGLGLVSSTLYAWSAREAKKVRRLERGASSGA